MKFKILSSLALALAAFPLQAAEDYTTWTGTREIVVNTTATGADVREAVYNVPILIRLGPEHAAIFAGSKSDGSDIRFVTPGIESYANTPQRLQHQIERWDRANQKAEIWVRFPVIQGNSRENRVLLRWGNPSAADSSKPDSVFNESEGMLGAWHLGADSAYFDRANSVNSGNAATPKGNTGRINIASIEGVIGRADSLRGNGHGGGGFVGDHFDLGAGFSNTYNAVFLSAWVKPSASTAAKSSAIVSLSNGLGVSNIALNHLNGKQLSGATSNDTGQTSHLVSGSSLLASNEWQHVVYTANENEQVLYRNGVVVARIDDNTGVSGIGRNTTFIGRSSWDTDPTLGGGVDEVVIAGVYRDSNWIKLAYQTQRPDARAVIIAGDEPASDLRLNGPPTSHWRNGDGIQYDARLNYQNGLKVTGGNYARTAYGTYSADSMEVEWVDFYGNPSYKAHLKADSLTLVSYHQNYGGPQTEYSRSTMRSDLIRTPTLLTQSVYSDTLSSTGPVLANSVQATNVQATNITTQSITATEVVTTPKWEVIPDYVFEKGYARKSLSEVETFVRDNKHLPGIPSARQIAAKGMSLTEMNLSLLRTVEELTLHVIDMNKDLEDQKRRNARLEKKVERLGGARAEGRK